MPLQWTPPILSPQNQVQRSLQPLQAGGILPSCAPYKKLAPTNIYYSRTFYHAQTPHLVPECIVLSLPHLHGNFLAPGAINLVNHWNNYEDHGGMVNSKPSFGRQVCCRCLSSVVDLHLRCGPAQHRPFACTLPQTYREKNFKLLLSICLKFIQHILR